MKYMTLLLSFSSMFLVLVACGGKQEQSNDPQWSKPQRVLEGCDGVISNSKQCQQNPNTQQMMIEIDRH